LDKKVYFFKITLVNDPFETTNVYNENHGVATQLGELLEKYKEQGYSRPK